MVCTVIFSLGSLDDAGDDVLRPLRSLRGNPGFGAVRADVHGAIHRLHGGVRGEREFVSGFDFFRGRSERRVGVAIVANDLAGLRGVVEKLLVQRCRGFARRAAPSSQVILQSFAALHGGPGIIGDDGDAAGSERARGHWIDGENVANASDGFGFRRRRTILLCRQRPGSAR